MSITRPSFTSTSWRTANGHAAYVETAVTMLTALESARPQA